MTKGSGRSAAEVNLMSEKATIDPLLLELLACPGCRGKVRQEGEWILCDGCCKRYPIRENIPVMLLDQAEPWPAE